MTEDLKFLMQRVVSRKFHNVKVNDEILAGVNHVCNLVIHSILYYSFPEELEREKAELIQLLDRYDVFFKSLSKE